MDAADAWEIAVTLEPRLRQLEGWAREEGLTPAQRTELDGHAATIVGLRALVDTLPADAVMQEREWHQYLRRRVAQLEAHVADCRYWTT
jgi:hypothetical protein